MRSNWTKAIILGLVFGMVTGLICCFRIPDVALYCAYGLHRTVASETARGLDKSVFMFVSLAVSIWLCVRVRSLMSGLLGTMFTLMSGLGLSLGFLRLSLLVRSPFALRMVYPWDMIDPDDYKTSWIVLGITVLATAAISLLIGRLARTSVRQVETGTARFVAAEPALSRVLNSRALAVICITALALPNLSYAALTGLYRHQAASMPNIIWIMSDSLRADHLGCYGYGKNTTPNIDRLARESALYTNAIAQASLTRLSVPSFLTGVYPQSCRERLPIAKVLSDRGYDTSAIVGNIQCSVYGEPLQVMRKFDHFNPSPSKLGINSPAILSAAIAELDKKRDSPLFMFLLFMDTHAPYRRHEGYRFWEPRDVGYPSKLGATDLKPTYEKHYAEDELRYTRSLYDSGIGYTDAHIGQLLDELKKRGLYEKSMIIFIGDHGEEFGEHRLFFHGNNLYNNAVNVPVIVKLPNENRGRRVGGTFSLIDIYPSILKTLGVPRIKRLEGREQDLKSGGDIRDHYVFSTLNVNKATNFRSIQLGKIKFVYNLTTKKRELYDLSSDPGEMHNLSSKNPGLAEGFYKALITKEHELSGKRIGWIARNTEQDPSISKADKESLRALGYLQ